MKTLLPENIRILVCVVLYKRRIIETDFFKSFLSSKKDKSLGLLIYDNSPNEDEDTTVINQIEIFTLYFHNPQNSGIAGAYKYAEKISSDNKIEWISFFDQDTWININYFRNLYCAIGLHKGIKLFCPIVKSNNVIISPGKFLLGRSWIQKRQRTGLRLCKNTTIINSGLAIKVEELTYLKGYNTDLPLDYSDHYFYFKYKKNNEFFYLLDICNKHELSSFNETDYTSTRNRFEIYIRASFVFSELIKNKMVIFWALLRAVKLSFKFKSTSFVAYIFSISKK